MVGCFLGEDLGKAGIFRQERDFRLCLFCGDGEFHCHCELGNKWGVWEEAFAIATEDPVDLAVVQGMLEILVLHVMIKVIIELRVIDSVYVDMAMDSGKGFSKEGVVPLDISGVGGVEVFRLVTGFGDGQGLSNPVDGGVCDTEPEESEDDVFTSTTHYIKEMFLSYPLDVGVEGASIADCTSFIHSLVDVANSNGGGKFFCGESVFPDELPVDAGDVGTRVY